MRLPGHPGNAEQTPHYNTLSIEVRRIADIHPYDKNPRKNESAVDAVCESIRQCGYIAPIILDEDGVILPATLALRLCKSWAWKKHSASSRLALLRSRNANTAYWITKRTSWRSGISTYWPVKLFDYQIQNNTKGGDIVLDLFGGSGTTIAACEQNGRTGYVMELDPRYCDVIISRWEALSGEKAVLLK